MGEVQTTRGNGNDAARIEFLIVLDYLRSECFDAEHLSKRKLAVEFALKEYGISIRPDRVTTILNHLFQIYQKHPDKFPFLMHAVTSKKGNAKYYISKQSADEKDLLSIGTLIYRDESVTQDDALKALDRFLSRSVSIEEASRYRNKIIESQKKGKIRHLSTKENNVIAILENVKESHTAIYFRLHDSNNLRSHNNKFIRYYSSLGPMDQVRGYVYQILNKGEHRKLVIEIPVTRSAIIVQLDSMIIYAKDSSSLHQDDFHFYDNKYKSIAAWLDAHYRGQDGFATRVTIKWPMDDQVLHARVCMSIREYFGLDELKITKTKVKRKNICLDHYEGVPKTKIEEGTDASVTIVSNIDSFRNWYFQGQTFRKVEIVSPAIWNNILLGGLVNELSERLNRLNLNHPLPDAKSASK